MKRFLPVVLLALLSGCVHHEFVCGNALFVFIDGGVQAFTVNFRDDRLLKSDVILSGHLQEWTPGPKWNVEPYFSVSATLDAKEKIAVIELAVEHGTTGAHSYSRVVVFKAVDFVGSTEILPFDFGGAQPDGQVVLNFKRGDEWLRREVDLSTLLKKSPNQAPEPTPLRVTPAAFAPVAPRSVAARL